MINTINEFEPKTVHNREQVPDYDPLEQALNNAFNDQNLSFNAPITDEPLKFQQSPEDKLIKKEIYIDKFTIKRDRVVVTPSVCDVCALDIAVFNGLGSWDKVPEDRKTSIIAALREHKKLVHPTREDLVINRSEMPNKWLGDKGTTL